MKIIGNIRGKVVLLLAALALLANTRSVVAGVRLPQIFSDQMVLQRDAAVTVWGWADAGEKVKVAFAGQARTASANATGKWSVELAAMPASTEARELSVTGNNSSVIVTNVLVGEVWLCSGQSNMEWALGRSRGGPEAVTNSANPLLRLCTVPHNSQMTPQDDVAARWAVSGPNSTKFFSAVAWWFGSKLQKELGVPVGIINDSYGGTTIQAWMPADVLRNGPWPHDKSTDLALAKADYDRRVAEAEPAMAKYRAEKAAALAAKKTPPPVPAGAPGEFRGPSVLWNGMVAPLLKFRIRGVAWYQGESNGYLHIADTYGDLLSAMIAAWRAGFAQPDLPFLVFQISAYRKPQTDPNEASGMAQLREAQLKAVQATPRTALVVTLDLGEPDVHYLNKEPAGERATKAALALAYGRDLVASGPVFKSLQIKGEKASVRFSQVGGGLVAKDGGLSGFVLAGADRQFFFADARIEGDRVVVSSPKVARPVAIRYGWADLPKANLFNREGFPASPFRTDDWPISGGGNRKPK